MNKDTLEKIKADLISQKEGILSELKALSGGEHSVKFPNIGDKPDENALEVGEYETSLATDKILENNLRDIENALKRIEDGAYGTCKYCGKEIDEKRLVIRPFASACVECKTKLQKAA